MNVRLSDVIVFDVLDSYHPSVLFHILDHVRAKDVSHQVEEITDWERFQSPASELISPTSQNNSSKEVDKAARDFIASIASAYRLPTSKQTLSDLNKDLPGLDRLLKRKGREDCDMKPGIQYVKRQLTETLKPLEEWLGERHLAVGNKNRKLRSYISR
jgi:hypothetical protein